jgi:methionine salvage enolase-phosphatase E1
LNLSQSLNLTISKNALFQSVESFKAEECQSFQEFIIISFLLRTIKSVSWQNTNTQVKGLIHCTHGFARGTFAAHLYYGSLDTLEQARDEALQQSYTNAMLNRQLHL